MDSVFRQINQSPTADHWRRFRIVSAQYARLTSVLQALGSVSRELPHLASGSNRIFEITDDSRLVCITEPAILAPSPFYLKPESYCVAFTDHREAIGEYRRWIGENHLTAEPCGNVDESPLWMTLQREERFAWVDLECQILRAIQSFGQPDLEGEPVFVGLTRTLSDLLTPDQLELQLESPSDFWPGKPPGWLWIHALKREVVSTTLTPRLQRLLYRRERVLFVEELGSAYDIQIEGPDSSRPFRSCILLPLIGGTKPLGILKLFYRAALTPLPGDVEGLELLRRELSSVLDRGRTGLVMQRMAMVDGLTNLFNHRFFTDQTRTEFQRALRYQKRMAVVMIDIDDFKGYNDRYGHLAGDRVLAETAQTIRGVVRDIDFVSRYGGEEFGLILPEVDAQSGLIVAEKIRKAVEALRFISDDGEAVGSITISCGVTDNESAKTAEEMIVRADKALYWVKRHGRNLVRLSGEDE